MTRRFIVGVDGMTPEQNKALADRLASLGCGWWHWIGNFWLVSDSSGKLTNSVLRDVVLEIAPGGTNLVLEVVGSTNWSGFGPNSQGNEKHNMFRWLQDNWI